MSDITKPYPSRESKKKQITEMFNSIAKRYDFLNHLLSLGLDFYWRRRAVEYLKNKPKNILDIATGTADFAISAAKNTSAKITGIDISKNMLEIGKNKIKKKGYRDRITLTLADSENMPFSEDQFDAITVGFGVRNFENLQKGLSEIYRVLSTEGMVVILEPAKPKKFPLNGLYNIYFSHILPLLGKLISKHESAYNYLPESVESFPHGNDFCQQMIKAGFKECKHISLSFGIVALYVAIK